VDFIDDFDILRKLPAGLPAGLQSELGKPACLAASPEPGVSYGDYFYRDLETAERTGDLVPDETYHAATTYLKEHRYTKAIELSLSKLAAAREIIESVSQRQLPADWAPVQLLADDDRLDSWEYTGHDLQRQVIIYKTKDGGEGELSYAAGRVKLNWRLDWPARWWLWGVNVEPFGRDHATKGGSYDTGKRLVEEVFGGQAPLPVPYGFIVMAGQTKKISKSAGNVIAPADVYAVMPPEILRYFIVRSRPDKQLMFDPGLGLYNLIDEFAAAQADPQHEFRDAYNYAVDGKTHQVISSISFKHLVQVYQAARGDQAEILRILERTGYAAQVKAERDVIIAELPFVKNWLANYAPADVKFSVQQQLPADAALTDEQRSFLTILAAAIEEHTGELDGQAMHELIYAAIAQANLPAPAAFQAIYSVILGQDHGPKAGWFLASLERDWLIQRLHLQA
jgi:lysyl-tRNA synthetase class 1